MWPTPTSFRVPGTGTILANQSDCCAWRVISPVAGSSLRVVLRQTPSLVRCQRLRWIRPPCPSGTGSRPNSQAGSSSVTSVHRVPSQLSVMDLSSGSSSTSPWLKDMPP